MPFKVSANLEIELKMKSTSITSSDNYIFGIRATGNTTQIRTSTPEYSFSFGDGNKASIVADTEYHIFTKKIGQSPKIDEISGTTGSGFSTSHNLRLFGLYSEINGNNYYGKGALAYAKFNNNGHYYNFIPVIRHTDGAIGLLDLVELKFYGNSGSGSFVGGQPL